MRGKMRVKLPLKKFEIGGGGREKFDTILNYLLSQKLKFLGNGKFNYLTIILTKYYYIVSFLLWETAPSALFFRLLGQTHVNGWSRVIASQNGGLTSYISPLRLRVLQWSRHLFNYWKNKKTIIERFFILLIWNWIYIDHRKITWLWS